MTTTSNWGITPRESVERECRERGQMNVIDGCLDLLGGATDVDPTLIYALGGPPARWAVSGGEGGPDYWLRVWAARGLLWIWDDRAIPAIEKALKDPAWRVREMAAKVAIKHQLGDLLEPWNSYATTTPIVASLPPPNEPSSASPNPRGHPRRNRHPSRRQQQVTRSSCAR